MLSSATVALLVNIGLALAANAPAEIANFMALVNNVKSLFGAKDQSTLDALITVIEAKLDTDLSRGIADAQAGAAGQPMPAAAA